MDLKHIYRERNTHADVFTKAGASIVEGYCSIKEYRAFECWETFQIFWVSESFSLGGWDSFFMNSMCCIWNEDECLPMKMNMMNRSIWWVIFEQYELCVVWNKDEYERWRWIWMKINLSIGYMNCSYYLHRDDVVEKKQCLTYFCELYDLIWSFVWCDRII